MTDHLGFFLNKVFWTDLFIYLLLKKKENIHPKKKAP